MATNIGGAVRLVLSLAGTLMLAGAQGAAAGLLATADLLSDFRFDGGAVNYYPGYRDLTPMSRNQSGLAAKKGGGGASGLAALGADPSGFLHLSPGMSYAGGDNSKLRRVAELSSAATATTPQLLADSLQTMGVDSGPAGFDFLVRKDAVRGGLTSEYAERQIFVKVAGVAGNDWMGMYSSLADSASVSPAVRGPAIPAPPTLVLLLIVGIIPLIGSRRR